MTVVLSINVLSVGLELVYLAVLVQYPETNGSIGVTDDDVVILEDVTVLLVVEHRW